MRRPLEELFWSHVDKTAHPPCWLWVGCGSKARVRGHLPYGLFSGGDIKPNGQRRLIPAHRFAYGLDRIPPGAVVCHSCDNSLCVRPDHLWVGTQRDNLQDMQRKGRKFRTTGELSGTHKLTTREVDVIRARFAKRDISAAKLAREYGVGPKTVNDLLLLKTWRETESAVVYGPLTTREAVL